jgi:tetratricopeptide (TPR) repeat protein
MMFGDTKGAKSILSKMVAKYPDSYYGHKLLAVIYEKEGGMRKAIDEYVVAVDLKKSDYNSYYKISELLKDLGKKDEAIEMLEKLVRNKPDMYEASCLLGDLLCEQERFKEAASVYESALKFRPADYELYYNLGIVYTRLNDFQMAKDMYERAASINHKLWGAKYSLGQIALIEKEYALAEQYFKESLYDKDLEANSYYQLARIYAGKGEKDKALEFLNKAIEIDPRLLQKAGKEKIFKDIREFITVSVKMDEDPERDRNKEIAEEVKELEESHILIMQEKEAQEYLEETNYLIEDMNENTIKQRTAERVNNIINQEKLKHLQEKDAYEEMLNSIDRDGIERTKQDEDDDNKNE